MFCGSPLQRPRQPPLHGLTKTFSTGYPLSPPAERFDCQLLFIRHLVPSFTQMHIPGET